MHTVAVPQQSQSNTAEDSAPDTISPEGHGRFVEREPGVFTIKTVGGYHIEIATMLYNFRVVLTPIDNLEVWDVGWCFFGRDTLTWVRAVGAALAFDPTVDQAPAGYDKQVGRR